VRSAGSAEQRVPEARRGGGRPGERETPSGVARAGGVQQRAGGEEVGARGGAQGVGERLAGERADETVPAAAEERREEPVHVARGDRAAKLDERGQRRPRRRFAAGEAHGERRSAAAAVGVRVERSKVPLLLATARPSLASESPGMGLGVQ
jgi:hypothetical protein